eukprot:scaffold150154_cov33-Tisochrysis_lutea.AAC.1
MQCTVVQPGAAPRQHLSHLAGSGATVCLLKTPRKPTVLLRPWLSAVQHGSRAGAPRERAGCSCLEAAREQKKREEQSQLLIKNTTREVL